MAHTAYVCFMISNAIWPLTNTKETVIGAIEEGGLGV